MSDLSNATIEEFDTLALQDDKIRVKVKKLVPEAQVLPSNARPTDAGYDVVAIDDGTWSEDGRYIEYGTGIAIEMPPGYHCKLCPRSSNSKFDLLLCNSEGLVDNEYRGELKLRFKYVPHVVIDVPGGCKKKHIWTEGGITLDKIKIYKQGDRLVQIKFEKTIHASFEWADELSDTSRGAGGYGSTGR